MTYRIAFPVLALLVAGGCSGREATGPMTQGASPSASAAVSSVRSSVATSPRSGALHVTKECSEYTGLAGSFCTITSSNLKQIPVGSRVVYASAAGLTFLDSDIVLEAPKPGKNSAFGHCYLSFVTFLGLCTLEGETGKLTWSASADVSFLGGVNWAWDGTYSFGKD